MKHSIKTGGFVTILAVALLCTSCSNTRNTSNTKNATNATTSPTENIQNQATPLPTLKSYTKDELEAATLKELAPYEKKLAITDEQKESFLSKYSETDYKQALYETASNFDITENPNPRVAYDKEMKKLEEKYHCTNTVIAVPSSTSDYTIGADYLCINDNKKRDTIVMIHGFGQNRRHNLAITEKFLKFGYNVIQYDQRGGGENGAPRIVVGPLLEAEDAKAVLAYADKQLSSSNKLILWGLSYGGGTAGVALGDKKTDRIVDYAILDCAADDSINDSTFPYTNKLLQIICGKNLSDCNTAQNLKNATTPLLFLTSKADDTVPWEIVKNEYAQAGSHKKYIYISPNAKHGLLHRTNSKKYNYLIKHFLNDTLKQKDCK